MTNPFDNGAPPAETASENSLPAAPRADAPVQQAQPLGQAERRGARSGEGVEPEVEARTEEGPSGGPIGNRAGIRSRTEGKAKAAEQPRWVAGTEKTAEPHSAQPHPQGVEEETDPRRADDTYRVELENFEGPLDLLLHLIQQHELDIMDIPIAFITERYVAYVVLMRELNIDVASEYLVMAATLVHIKSKMLLPSVPDDQEDGDLEPEGDPRQELVRRLLEYQKYKDAAQQLGARDVFGRDVYARGTAAPEIEGPAPLADIPIFKLLDAFQSVLDRVQKTLDHEIEFDRLSITERINELVDRLKGVRRCKFEDLFEGQRTRADMIVTFLALLEMTRLRMMRLIQETPLAPIEIESCLEDEAEAEVAPAAEPGPAAGTDSKPEPEPAPEPAAAAAELEPVAKPASEPEPDSAPATDPEGEPEAEPEPEPGPASDSAAAAAADSAAEPEPEPASASAAIPASAAESIPVANSEAEPDPESVAAQQADPTTDSREGRATEDESGRQDRGVSADEKDH